MRDFDDEEWFEWISMMDLIDDDEEERRARALAKKEVDLDDEEDDDWYEDFEDYECVDDEELEADEILGREVKRLEFKSGKKWTNEQRFLCELLLDSGLGKIETIVITNRMGKKKEQLPGFIMYVYNENHFRTKEEIYKWLKDINTP